MHAKQTTAPFSEYTPLPGTFDEVFEARDKPREAFAATVSLINAMGAAELRTRQRLAGKALLTGGITFNVYGDRRGGVERIFPFDVIPRIVAAEDWEHIDSGLSQRIRALNMFLADVYGDQRIIAEGHVPRDVVESSTGFLEKMVGVRPPGGVYVQVAGIDLIRGADGRFLVLEDNLRTPSGVSYVLENRAVMKRVLAPVLSKIDIRPVDEYPSRLRNAISSLAPERAGDHPRVVVLTPGPYNSAYFEHTFLARRMGCDLVCPTDLFVHDDTVFVKTTAGPQRVDVIYRRIDDDFLDPEAFRADSLLGVRGIVRAYARGNVTLANGIGNGVADDKGVYPYVPAMIRFYLSEEPILGQVETYHCENAAERDHVLQNLASMVTKDVNGSGGYGMLIGPRAAPAEIEEFRQRIKQRPRSYIAQPLVELSACPTWLGDRIAPRRVDLRPFIVTGRSTWVLPGGLTRVALAEGSYVVNSSQGGGSKDTWVLQR
ncbi:MAG: circularly permuted type 2 ATP-grasp protein [Myxococcales bacterium]|nr:circularly permuted type 2 ATP-grasp protein [Myxococcales bacterium]